MTRDEYTSKINALSNHLTYPELDDLHAINECDADQRAAIDTLNGLVKAKEARCEKYQEEIARLREALAELYALVKGECPSLLNEDSGGDAKLALELEDLLKTEHQS